MNDTAPVSPLEEFRQRLVSVLRALHLDSGIARGELSLRAPPGGIVEALTLLRDDPSCRFNVLVDICGADWPEREERFDVVYHLLSLKHNRRLRVKIHVGENVPVPSVVSVFPCANWHERETFDMFGVPFAGHPDLRRILSDYGFEGHPLRKDFPLTGFSEVRYDEAQKRVVYEPVSLPQDFRGFDYLSPWEGLTGIQLPGDGKAAIPIAAKTGGRG